MKYNDSKNNNVSVSELSAYAANPEAFCEVKGKAYNQELATWGTERHEQVGTGFNWRLVVFIVIGGWVVWKFYTNM